MTPQERLHRARLAVDEGERQTMLGDSGSLAPAMHYGRAQAHALIGILELLNERLPGPPAP